MPNVKYTPDAPQTKQKLLTYSRYLKTYLNILLPEGRSGRVDIYDLMAGSGSYDGEDGSAMRALTICKTHRTPDKHIIHLHLNEKDKRRHHELLTNIGDNHVEWVHCQNLDVNESIEKHCCNPPNNNQLFFLDPYGFTQIMKKSIDIILKSHLSEILLFVPVFTINRFAYPRGTESKQTQCVRDFLMQYGVDVKQGKLSPDGMVDRIKKAFQGMYGGKKVGVCKLNTGKQIYALYFIGSHELGLEKFIESSCSARRHAVLEIEGNKPFLSDAVTPKIDDECIEVLKYLMSPHNNVEIRCWGFCNDISPYAIKATLNKLKSWEWINVIYKKGVKERKGSYYLTDKNSGEKLEVVISDKGKVELNRLRKVKTPVSRDFTKPEGGRVKNLKQGDLI